MELLEKKKAIEDNYKMKVIEIERVKGSYKITNDEGVFAVKVIKYNYPHFLFILTAMKHLQRKGFKGVPEIISTKDNEEFIRIGKDFAYVTPWVKSRVSDYRNEDELMAIVEKLANMHKYSENFNTNRAMAPRIGWFSWIKVFETRCQEILDFNNRINQKAHKSEFDELFLSKVQHEMKRGYKAIDELREGNYYEIMRKQVMKRNFCHHDIAHHNVLIDENNDINIIDFDYTILDSNLHDLGSILIRTMKNGNWNIEKGKRILEAYNKGNSINEAEIRLLKGFIRFPQGFWQRGLQYYWEQQPWGEEFMLQKLKVYLKDIEMRDNFIDEFFQKGELF